MNQLSLLPIDPSTTEDHPSRPVTLAPRRVGRAPRMAVGAPGYMSVRAAAERLGLRPRSVRSAIERGWLRSHRLGRMHFLPTAQVEAYRAYRRSRRRR
jgi:excisionase family DNA binding protein